MMTAGGLRNAISRGLDSSSQAAARQAPPPAATAVRQAQPTTATADRQAQPTAEDNNTNSDDVIDSQERDSTTTVIKKKKTMVLRKPKAESGDDSSSQLESTLTSLKGRLQRLQQLASTAGQRRPLAASAVTVAAVVGETEEELIDPMKDFEFVRERTEADRVFIVYPNATVWPPVEPPNPEAVPAAASGQSAQLMLPKDEVIETSASEILDFPPRLVGAFLICCTFLI